MRGGISDTSPDVERVMIESYRRMPVRQRWLNLFNDYRMARSLHQAGHRHRHPTATDQDIQREWMQHTLGRDSHIPQSETFMDPVAPDVKPILYHVVQTFDRLGIEYAIGGSIASSLLGIGRMTRDADLTAIPFAGKVGAFVAAFPLSEYYLWEPTVREAIRTRSSFNILHPPTGYKIDVFVRKDTPFDRTAFDRRIKFPFADEPGGDVLLYTAEDMILFKLGWYRLGGGVSDQQWNDVQGVLKTQSDRLDGAYLRKWAEELKVADLLEEAFVDSGWPPAPPPS